MSKKLSWPLALGGVAVLAVVGAAHVAGRGSPASPSSVPSTQAGGAVPATEHAIPASRAHVYAVDYDDDEKVVLPHTVATSGTTSSTVSVRASIGRAQVPGKDGKDLRYQWWFESASQLSFSFGTTTVPIDLTAAQGRSVVSIHEPNGRLIGFETADEGETPIEERLLRMIVADAQFVASDAATSTVEERTRHGRGVYTYLHAPQQHTKSLQRYSELDVRDALYPKAVEASEEHATARFDAEALGTLEARRDVSLVDARGQKVTSMRMRLRLVDRGPAAVVPPYVEAALVARVGANARGGTRRSHAGGLTAVALAEQLRRSGNGGSMPDHNRFLWRSNALLREHPEAAESLRDVYLERDANHARRGLVADLLASAGTKQAQTVLCDVLASKAADGDDGKGLLVQRLSFVERPTPETVAFAKQSLRANTDASLTGAWENVLGSLVHAMAVEMNDPEGAAAANEQLREQLLAASTPQAIAAALYAMGNAGLLDNVPTVLAYVAHPSPVVRAAAADALRRTQAESSERALLQLLADSVPQVQLAAIETLGRYQLRESLLSAVAGSYPAIARDEPVLTALTSLARKGYLSSPLGARRLLEQILPEATGELRAEVEGAIALIDAQLSTN